MHPCGRLGAGIFLLTALEGCACDPAIVENRSDTRIEVTVWAPTGGFLFPRLEVYRNIVEPGGRWRASCTDRVDPEIARPDAADMHVHSLPADGGLGRSWLITIEQRAPSRLRVLGDGSGLRFESFREDGVTRSSHYLKVREDVWMSDSAIPRPQER